MHHKLSKIIDKVVKDPDARELLLYQFNNNVTVTAARKALWSTCFREYNKAISRLKGEVEKRRDIELYCKRMKTILHSAYV